MTKTPEEIAEDIKCRARRVRPADGIPVVPYIDEIATQLDALLAKLREAGPELEREWLAWAAAHPVLRVHVSIVAGVFQNLLHPAAGHSAADRAEAMRGVILNFKMALAFAEMTQSFLAEKH